jgi:hypothetical protein
VVTSVFRQLIPNYMVRDIFATQQDAVANAFATGALGRKDSSTDPVTSPGSTRTASKAPPRIRSARR